MKANTKIFGCIADPINHVKAPTLFTKMFQEQKINATKITKYKKSSFGCI